MTTMAATRQALRPNELRGWPAPVATALLAIVNNRGVKHRMIDGGHLLLFPPDGATRPVKFSAHRPEKDNLRYLDLFVNRHLGRYAPEPADDRPATETELAALAALNGPEHTEPEEPQPDPRAETYWQPYIAKSTGLPTIYVTNAEGTVYRCTRCAWTTSNARQLGGHVRGLHKDWHPENYEPPAPWEPHAPGGRVSTFETNGTAYRCTVKGCRWTTTNQRSIGGHARSHVRPPAPRKPEETTHQPDQDVTTTEPEPTPTPEPEAPVDDAQRLRDALRQIARIATDVLGDDHRDEELAQARIERDEAIATLELLRETLGMLS